MWQQLETAKQCCDASLVIHSVKMRLNSFSYNLELWLSREQNFRLYPKADSPRLKSAVQSGRSRKPSPGLEGEIRGEKETLLLLQSKSWSREGSKSGVSSNSILQYLLRRSNQTGRSTHTHTHSRIHPRPEMSLQNMMYKDDIKGFLGYYSSTMSQHSLSGW